ncbi:hypothetical protein POTOM_033604 [Populus tomentosa]|uniref:Fatty acyl-CoA reductase n=1 Tax=Populus tomentosa TaxID=118781 RepID=A0A8X8CR12_POPTO|nr:hypothetical protein POTOM_033604 [Populus tomentosa]
MEFGSVVQFLEDKTILITGATGFLAKILLEKILRVQPKVKKIYLLLRAADAKSASQRLQNEVIGKDLFRILKEKWGENLNSIVTKKIVLVPGDISHEDDLGVKDSNLREEMWSQLDVVVNLAATTNFDEGYDVALGINTMGAKHVLCFAKKCVRLKVLVHVSTGERAGLILETPYGVGDTLNGVCGLDIDEEKKLVDQKLNELQAEGATADAIKDAMKDMGMERAKVYGWPNTCVFTKAMGEMLVGHLKEDLSVVIIRPTIVTSTYKEPFPGWVEGVRTIDSLAVGYGKGRLTCFLGDITGIVDVIPADMVVNAIIVAMVAHANRPSENAIYQVGSSVRNPMRYTNLQDCGFNYFTNKPWIGKDGRPVKVGRVKVLSSRASFHRYMAIRYLLLLKGLELANTAFCHFFEDKYSDLNRKIKFVMKLVELYRPYLFFRGVFDDLNTEKLRMAARENNLETDMFYFDPKTIDWEDYLTNIHFPGVLRMAYLLPRNVLSAKGLAGFARISRSSDFLQYSLGKRVWMAKHLRIYTGEMNVGDLEENVGKCVFVFVEKILRVQPNVKKFYLLLRAADAKSATERLRDEVIAKDLFRVLREKHGAGLHSFISEKVTPVPGDISHEDLGVKDSSLKDEMWREIDVMLNFAATTNFDERYDVALGINTLGALHVLNFAKKCVKIKMLVHVSTAYVCGEDAGLILEQPYHMGMAKKGDEKIDINFEKRMVQEKLNELKLENVPEKQITSAMKDFGIERARLFGWPNTYVFTKAMGEMLLVNFKDSLPLVIIRPTMVASTYKEPFPGWIEGVRTIDSIIVGYGKGRVTCFISGPRSTLDVIPADMVVNAIIVAMVARAKQHSEIIYHLGSSFRNPVNFSNLHDFSFRYFSEHPWINKEGDSVKIGKGIVLSSMSKFYTYMAIRFLLPLKV